MKNIFFVAVALALALSACNDAVNTESGNSQTANMPLAAENLQFSSIGLSGSLDAVIEHSDNFTYRITGEQSDLDKLDVEIKRGKLIVGPRRGENLSGRPKVEITGKDIIGLMLSGSGQARCTKSVVSSDDARFTVSGSGSINGVVDSTKNFRAVISGSGRIKVSGKADEIIASISGSGDFEGFDFQTDKARITISGSGECEIGVNTLLNATISGSGNVYYLGQPTVETFISGSGKVIPRGN